LLVRDTVGGETRLGMLETVREFALERLDAVGEADDARERHAGHYLALAAGAGRDGAGFDRLEREHDNLRAALRWLTARGETGRALRLGTDLWGFWAIRGHLAEGRAHVAALLALPGSVPTADRAHVLQGAGRLALNRETTPPPGRTSRRAWRCSEESLAMLRALGQVRLTAELLCALGNLARDQAVEYALGAQADA